MPHCSQCGECCRWIPIARVQDCDMLFADLLRTRGVREDQGFFLVEHRCPKLAERLINDMPNRIDDLAVYRCGEGLLEVPDMGEPAFCSIYPDRPFICRVWTGVPKRGLLAFWIPPGCTQRDIKEGDKEVINTEQ